MNKVNGQKIHFVTGKGGVGKSFFAAGLAHFFALESQNTPVLLAETNERSFYKDYLGLNEINYQPQTISLGNGDLDKAQFDIAQWSPDGCLREYALHLLKIESLYKMFFQNPISKALIQVAPGLQELAILGKATSSPRQHGPKMNYRQIVIDTFSTGHFLAAFRAPQAMANTIKFGPMGEQSRQIHRWITNPDFCEVHLVTLPEELPVVEAIELSEKMNKEFGLSPKIYLNKTYDLVESDLNLEAEQVKNFFLQQIQRQKNAENLLQKHNLQFYQVPFFPILDSKEVVRTLSKFMVEQKWFK